MLGVADIGKLHDYCERAGHIDYWAEPVNALSNFAFCLAAMALIFFLYRNRSVSGLSQSFWVKSWDVMLLIALIICVGLGSFAWHTIPNFLTENLDIDFIALFNIAFVCSFYRRVVAWPWWAIIVFVVVYLVLSVVAVTGLLVDAKAVNGSIGYFPTIAVLIVTWLIPWQGKSDVYKRLFITTIIVFLLSITFRSLDHAMCHWLPMGTHFLWHILNSIVLFMFVFILIRANRSITS